jgi:chromosome segregation ATPase
MTTSNVIRLSAQEWQRIVQLGVERQIQELQEQLAEAQQEIAQFERRFGTSFARLQETGLPEDASMEAHEDYVEWSSWEGRQADLQEQLETLHVLLRPASV